MLSPIIRSKTGALNFASYKGMIYLTFDWSTCRNHCIAIFSGCAQEKERINHAETFSSSYLVTIKCQVLRQNLPMMGQIMGYAGDLSKGSGFSILWKIVHNPFHWYKATAQIFPPTNYMKTIKTFKIWTSFKLL